MCDNTGKTMVSFLVGALVGGTIGMLFAPDEGEKTRKKIKKSFDETSDSLKESIETLNETLKNKFNTVKGSLEDNIEALLSRSNYKSDEAIEVLEKKLEQLKKQVAKLQK